MKLDFIIIHAIWPYDMVFEIVGSGLKDSFLTENTDPIGTFVRLVIIQVGDDRDVK